MWRFLAASILLVSVSGGARAHFIFLELAEDAAVTMRFSEVPGEATKSWLQELAAPMVVRDVNGETVAMSPGEGALTGKASPGTRVVRGSLDYGVLDREKEGRGVFMLVYHAKGVAGMDVADKPVGMPLEVLASEADGRLTVTVLRGGKPVAGAEVVVSVAGVELEGELASDASGEVSLALPGPGVLGVRALVKEDRQGEAEGKTYSQVRHYTTLVAPRE